jgi:1-acyl-sn-glycerol-3-phosphate acyltransferase
MAFTASRPTPAVSRRRLLAPLFCLYGVYAITVFLLFAGCALLATLMLPGVRRRRAAARLMARVFFRCAGMPLTVSGLERLPPGQCVVVSNHASYLDGVVFTAALPPQFSFVIKREMSRVPLAGLLLRQLGSEFVERFNRHRGGADARRVFRTAAGGNSLAFFPEGTFPHEPGVLRFHIGAFVTAARAGCPLVPACVRGSRHALPPGGFLPRPGRIVVEILTPIRPQETTAEVAAMELRLRARQTILAQLGEPDLEATCCDDTDRQPHTTRVRSGPANRL